MAAQYDLCRLPTGGLVVILQSDLLDQIQTRVVAPLVPASSVGRVMTSLNPSVTLGEETYLVMPQLAATLTLAELGEKVGSLSMMHDAIVRAVDALLSGIAVDALSMAGRRLRRSGKMCGRAQGLQVRMRHRLPGRPSFRGRSFFGQPLR